MFHQAWLFYVAIVVLIVVSVFFRYTSLGLPVVAAGADPRPLDKSGLSVMKVRYGAVLFTGLMSALGGCFLSIYDIHTFTEGMTNGVGYLAIAGVIFGNWKIGRTIFACLLFGAATALQFQLPAMGVDIPNAFLIMLPYVLALLAVAGLVGRQTAPPALTQPYRRAAPTGALQIAPQIDSIRLEISAALRTASSTSVCSLSAGGTMSS